ncbi:hypothetical protein LXL04_038960 [Taraxacum kok-saghyz]
MGPYRTSATVHLKRGISAEILLVRPTSSRNPLLSASCSRFSAEILLVRPSSSRKSLQPSFISRKSPIFGQHLHSSAENLRNSANISIFGQVTAEILFVRPSSNGKSFLRELQIVGQKVFLAKESSAKDSIRGLSAWKINSCFEDKRNISHLLEDADFNFKKFEVSSATVETMIEKHLKFKDQSTEGLRYSAVPPPYNDNYTPPLEPVILRRPVPVCQPTMPVSVKIEQPKHVESVKLNDSNASTSCADKVLVEDWDEDDENDSNSVSVENSTNTNILSLVVSKTCGDAALNLKSNLSTIEKYKPKTFVRQSDKCTCTCGNSGKQKQIPNRDQQTSHRPGPSPNCIVLKRQTCFNYGIAGHIARNCQNPSPVPKYAQYLKNVPKRYSSKRKPSRSHSTDSDWNVNKAKTRTLPDKNQTHIRKSNLRDSSTKPKSVRSKPYQRPSHSQHLKPKPKSKGRPNSKSSVEAPIRSNKRPKPDYRWVPKVPTSKSHQNPVITSCSLSINRICHGKKYNMLTAIVNLVTKWTGFLNLTNPAVCAGVATEEYHQTLIQFLQVKDVIHFHRDSLRHSTFFTHRRCTELYHSLLSAESNDYIISLKQEYQEQIKNTIAFRDLLSNLYNAHKREENELVN